MKLAHSAAAVGVAATIALSLALTGCSGGGGGGGNTQPPDNSNQSGNSSAKADVPTKTYTNDDLVKILTTANATLNAGGTVTKLGPVSSQNTGRPVDLYAEVLGEGGSISPSSCGPLFQKIDDDDATLGDNTGAYAAKLEYASSVLNVTSSASPIDVTNLTNLLSADLDALTSSCASTTISMKSLTAALTFTKGTETTDATTTYSYREDSSFNGKPVSAVAIIAVDGNLLIGFVGLDGVTYADGDKAIDAVVAAAATD